MTADSQLKDARSAIMRSLRQSSLLALALVVLFSPALLLRFVAGNRSLEEPLQVARSYLRATLARDYTEAYRFVSSADRQIADRVGYLEAQQQFRGFALRLAKRLAAQIEFRVVEHEINGDRVRLTLDYTLPATDALSPLLVDWNPDKLNALTGDERQRIIGALGKITQAPNVITAQGRETFNLVSEDGRWKIFLDLASGIPVSFDAAVPANGALEVEVLNRKLFADTDEPFQTGLKIRNRGERQVVARIDHRIEPKKYAGHVAMIACGFVRPMTLQPGEERDVSSAYLLDPDFPRNTAVAITFAFDLASAPHTGGAAQRPSDQ